VNKRAVALYRDWRDIAVVNTSRNMKVKAMLMKAMHKLSNQSYNSWKSRAVQEAARARKAKGIGNVLLERDVKKTLTTWTNAVYEKRVMTMKIKRVLKVAFNKKAVKALVTWVAMTEIKVARNAKVESCLSKWKMQHFGASMDGWRDITERRSATKSKLAEVAGAMNGNTESKGFSQFILIGRDTARRKAAMSKVLEKVDGLSVARTMNTWATVSKDILERKERAQNALVMMQEGDLYIAWGSLVGYASVRKERRAIRARERAINNDRMLRQALMNMKMSFMYYKISTGSYQF